MAGWVAKLINQLMMPKVSVEEDGGSSSGIDAAGEATLNTNDGSDGRLNTPLLVVRTTCAAKITK